MNAWLSWGGRPRVTRVQCISHRCKHHLQHDHKLYHLIRQSYHPRLGLIFSPILPLFHTNNDLNDVPVLFSPLMQLLRLCNHVRYVSIAGLTLAAWLFQWGVTVLQCFYHWANIDRVVVSVGILFFIGDLLYRLSSPTGNKTHCCHFIYLSLCLLCALRESCCWKIWSCHAKAMQRKLSLGSEKLITFKKIFIWINSWNQTCL